MPNWMIIHQIFEPKVSTNSVQLYSFGAIAPFPYAKPRLRRWKCTKKILKLELLFVVLLKHRMAFSCKDR